MAPPARNSLQVLRRALVPALAAYGLALVVIFHTPVVDWLALPLYIPAAPERSDAIVVLGAWASTQGDLNESGLRRSIRAAELYKGGVAPLVVVTGSTPDDVESGSAVDAMAALLRLAGVPPDAIVLEKQSENTHDSAVHVAAIARARQWSRVALVTDAAHVLRARLAFERAGLPITPAGTGAIWDLGGESPSIRLRKLDAIAHEYLGLAYYRLRDWI